MTQPIGTWAVVANFIGPFLVWGWLFVLFFALWVLWEVYLFIKRVDYASAIQFTFYQVKVPDESAQTPKAMENAYEVWGGIHKDPDLIEALFEGYQLPWYSCELQCSRGRARYILVVPTTHAKFFEGVIYGQYPTAEVTEVEDYTQEYNYRELDKKFDLYGSEIVLVEDDIYPLRMYQEFEDSLAEDDRFIDPHQALVEAYTNIEEGEHFWVQILVKPVGGDVIKAWSKKGQDKIAEISGREVEKSEGFFGAMFGVLSALPLAMLSEVLSGPTEPGKKKEERKLRLIPDAAQDAIMRGILQKVSRSGFKTKIRVIHIAPAGKLHKPNIAKAIGAFKQFNSFHLNALKPDSASKTNGPNYILKQSRRRYRKRVVLVNYQYRDFWGDSSGQMFSAEELATLYHFPIKYVKAPAIDRATSGLGSPPGNLPYV